MGPFSPLPKGDDGAAAFIAVLSQVQENMQRHALLISELTHNLQENTRGVDAINRILRDGNGSKSLVVRVELIEQTLSRLFDAVTTVQRSLDLAHTEESKAKWSLANTVVTSILGVIAGLLTAVLAHFLK